MVKHEGDLRIVTLSADYNNALKRWEMIDDFCAGDRETLVNKYLVQHFTEKVNSANARELWAGRKQRTGYEDDAKPFLDIHTGHLGREVNFGKLSEDPQFKAIIDDVTGYGETAQELYQQKVEAFLKYGLLAVLVDGPSEIAADKKTAQENRERSYQVLFTGRQILHFNWFEFGPRKGQVREVILAADPVMVDNELREAAHYWYMPALAGSDATSNFIKEFLIAEAKDPKDVPGEKKFKATNPVTGTIPVIPIEIVGRGIGDSAMRGVVSQSWKIFNSISVCDSINHNQGFVWNVLFGVNQSEVGEKHEAGVTLVSNPEAHVESIPAGVPTGYENQIQREKATLRRIGMWENQQMADDTAQVQSADSKARDQKARLKNYEDRTNKLERAERRIWGFHALYEGKDPSVVTVTVERDFGLDDPTATQATRTLQFTRANSKQLKDVTDNIIKLDILEMDIVPRDDETVEDARARMMKAVDEAEPMEQPILGSSFFGGKKPPPGNDNKDDKPKEDAA